MAFDHPYEEEDIFKSLQHPVYISFANNELGTFRRETFINVQQTKLSFGILKIESATQFKYSQFDSFNQIDHFEVQLDKDFGLLKQVRAKSRQGLYLIALVFLVFMIYFVYNWLSCMLSGKKMRAKGKEKRGKHMHDSDEEDTELSTLN